MTERLWRVHFDVTYTEGDNTKVKLTKRCILIMAPDDNAAEVYTRGEALKLPKIFVRVVGIQWRMTATVELPFDISSMFHQGG